MTDELLEEPNEEGAMGSFLRDPIAGPMVAEMLAQQQATVNSIPTEADIQEQEAQAREELDSDPISQIVGALLGAAIGAAVDGKQGALIGAGGASRQILKKSEDIEARLNKKLTEIRKSAETKRAAADKSRGGIQKLVLTETLKDRRAELTAKSRERAAILSRTPGNPFSDADVEKIELGRQNMEELAFIRERLNDVGEGDWVAFVKESLDPKSAAADVIADLSGIAIGLATEKQKGVLTEKDVAPFRSKAGLRAFKDKASLIQAVDRLMAKGDKTLLTFASNARKRNTDPTGYVEGLRDEAGERLSRSALPTATNKETGEKSILINGKWEPL